MMVVGLVDASLRVVMPKIGRASEMLSLLHARYASSRTVSRIAVQTKHFRIRYTGGDMSRYADESPSLLNQLAQMGPKIAIPEEHKPAFFGFHWVSFSP